MIIDGVIIEADVSIPHSLIEQEVANERVIWLAKNKVLAKMTFAVDGDEIVIEAKERSPISRIRRLTGYLSKFDNFNEAKKAEAIARRPHVNL